VPKRGRATGKHVNAHASTLNETLFPGSGQGYHSNYNGVNDNSAYLGSPTPIPRLRSNY